MKKLLTVILLAAAPLCAISPTPPKIESFETEKKVDQLMLLLQKRLVIMHEVARTKWSKNLAIEDKAREQQLIAGLVDQAKQLNLDEQWITSFFQAQFEAAKEIQKQDFATWYKESDRKFDVVLDLKTDLRLYIDKINQEMLKILSTMDKKDLSSGLILSQPISTRDSDEISEQVWNIAIAPFGNVAQ